jgi:hypothetical protein
LLTGCRFLISWLTHCVVLLLSLHFGWAHDNEVVEVNVLLAGRTRRDRHAVVMRARRHQPDGRRRAENGHALLDVPPGVARAERLGGIEVARLEAGGASKLDKVGLAASLASLNDRSKSFKSVFFPN